MSRSSSEVQPVQQCVFILRSTTMQYKVCMYVQRESSLTARYARGSPRLKAFGTRLLNYPWVDTRPAKYLGAHTSLN